MSNEFVPINSLPLFSGVIGTGMEIPVQIVGVTYKIDLRQMPLATDTFLTWVGQPGDLPNSRLIVAGAGIAFTMSATELEISAPGGAGVVVSIVGGTGITVDATDPANPIVAVDLTASLTWTVSQTFNGLYMATGPILWTGGSIPATPAAGDGALYAATQNGHTSLNWIDEDGTRLRLLRDSVLLVYNDTGSTITKGTVVDITGSTGNVPTVGLADADVLTSHAEGFMVEDVVTGDYGLMMTTGAMYNLNTSAFTEGAKIYLSQTAGQYTLTPPSSPAILQELGTIIRQHATLGVIEISVGSVMPNGSSGGVATVNDGRYIDVDNTDPVNPIVNLSQTKQSPNTTGGTPVLNASYNTVFVLTLTEDITSITFNNVPGGPQVYTATIIIAQDGTGGWSVTWPAAFMWSEGTTPVLDTTAGSIQVLQAFTYDGGASWFAAQVMSNVA